MKKIYIIISLTCFSNFISSTQIQLADTINYELDGIGSNSFIENLFKEHQIRFTSYRAQYRWVRFDKKTNQKKEFFFGGSNLPLLNCALLKTPHHTWIAVSKKPDRDEEQMLGASSKKKYGASVIVDDENFINKFAVVDIDWDKVIKEKDGPIPLETIWDPENGIYNKEVQEDICGWLKELAPGTDIPSCNAIPEPLQKPTSTGIESSEIISQLTVCTVAPIQCSFEDSLKLFSQQLDAVEKVIVGAKSSTTSTYKQWIPRECFYQGAVPGWFDLKLGCDFFKNAHPSFIGNYAFSIFNAGKYFLDQI